MIKYFSLIFIFVSFSCFSGVHLKCNVLEVFNEFGTEYNDKKYGNNAQLGDASFTLGVIDIVQGYCEPTKKWANKLEKKGQKAPKPLTFNMAGVGLGLRLTGSSFWLSCPLVRAEREILKVKNGQKSLVRKSFTDDAFVGVKLQAAAIAGMNVGIFSNSRLGLCMMGGLDLGLGASLTLDYLSFSHKIMH